MSRGLGRVQRAVLAVLTEFEPERRLSSTMVAACVVGHDHPSHGEHNAVCAALMTLQRRGLAASDHYRRWGTLRTMRERHQWPRMVPQHPVPTAPQRVDSRSGWSTAPPLARALGDDVYRAFDDLTSVKEFLRQSGRVAERQRRRRDRVRRGEIVLKVAVPEHPIAEFLIRSGRLRDDEALDRHRVELAVADAVLELAGRWSK